MSRLCCCWSTHRLCNTARVLQHTNFKFHLRITFQVHSHRKKRYPEPSKSSDTCAVKSSKRNGLSKSDASQRNGIAIPLYLASALLCAIVGAADGVNAAPVSCCRARNRHWCTNTHLSRCPRSPCLNIFVLQRVSMYMEAHSRTCNALGVRCEVGYGWCSYRLP